MSSSSTNLLLTTLFRRNLRLPILTLFSPREIDFSWPQGEAPLKEQHFAALREWTGNDAVRFATVRQVHGDAVQLIDSNGSSETSGTADALITRIPDVALMIRTADCLPVFLYDAVSGAVGLIHAGWRSTELCIVEKTVTAMRKNFGTEPRNIQAGFGPAIRACCYEVGPEFQTKFPDGIDQRQGKYFLDLIRVNLLQLINSGVSEDHITDSGLCTACDSQFFSYRRDGAAAGRHLSLICRIGENQQ